MLASKSGVSYPQYSRYEAGEQLPKPSLRRFPSVRRWESRSLRRPWNGIWPRWREPRVRPRVKLRHFWGRFGPTALRLRARSRFPFRSMRSSFSIAAIAIFFSRIRRIAIFSPTSTHFMRLRKSPPKKFQRPSRFLRRNSIGMLENLIELGVIHKHGKRFAAAKSNFYFPDDTDFFELRQQNVRHNLEKVLDQITYSDLQEKRALRGLLTRELTPSQLGWVMGQIEGLLGRIVELPEDPRLRRFTRFARLWVSGFHVKTWGCSGLWFALRSAP